MPVYQHFRSHWLLIQSVAIAFFLLAHGTTASAQRYAGGVQQVQGSGSRLQVLEYESTTSQTLTYTIAGAVNRSGVFTSSEPSIPISQLLEAAEGLASDAVPSLCVIRNGWPRYRVTVDQAIQNPDERLLAGDVVIVAFRQPMNGEPPAIHKTVPVVCLGLINRPVLLPLDPTIYNTHVLAERLLHGPQTAAAARVIDPYGRSQRSDLIPGTVVVFQPSTVSSLTLASVPRFPTPILELEKSIVPASAAQVLSENEFTTVSEQVPQAVVTPTTPAFINEPAMTIQSESAIQELSLQMPAHEPMSNLHEPQSLPLPQRVITVESNEAADQQENQEAAPLVIPQGWTELPVMLPQKIEIKTASSTEPVSAESTKENAPIQIVPPAEAVQETVLPPRFPSLTDTISLFDEQSVQKDPVVKSEATRINETVEKNAVPPVAPPPPYVFDNVSAGLEQSPFARPEEASAAQKPNDLQYLFIAIAAILGIGMSLAPLTIKWRQQEIARQTERATLLQQAQSHPEPQETVKQTSEDTVQVEAPVLEKQSSIHDLVNRSIPLREEKVRIPISQSLHGEAVGHRRLILDSAHSTPPAPHFKKFAAGSAHPTSEVGGVRINEQALRSALKEAVRTVTTKQSADTETLQKVVQEPVIAQQTVESTPPASTFQANNIEPDHSRISVNTHQAEVQPVKPSAETVSSTQHMQANRSAPAKEPTSCSKSQRQEVERSSEAFDIVMPVTRREKYEEFGALERALRTIATEKQG